MPLDLETLARRWPAFKRRARRTNWILSGELAPADYDLDHAYPFFRGRVTDDIQEWARWTKSDDPATQALIDSLISDPCPETIEALHGAGYDPSRLMHYRAVLGDQVAARDVAVHLLYSAPLNDQEHPGYELGGDTLAIAMIATALGYLAPPSGGEHPPTWWLDRLARIGAALEIVKALRKS